MRQKYIDIIREYINSRPDYKDTLNEIKANILIVGATEDEYHEALKQLAMLPKEPFIHDEPTLSLEKKQIYEKKITEKSARKKPNLKKSHIAYAALSLLVIFSLSWRMAWQSTPSNIKTNAQTSNANSKKTLSSFLVKPVYATSQKIDAEKVFSYPAANKVILTVNNKPKKEIFGFLPYWMLPEADKINIDTLTTISLFGLDVNGEGNIITTHTNGSADGGWNMWEDPTLDTFIQRAKRGKVHVVLTLKAFDNQNIDQLALSDKAQQTFITNAIYLMNAKDLDGINLDFEYTGEVSQTTRDGFSRLVRNLNTELKRQASSSTLTIDTYLTSGANPDLFDLPVLAENCDALIIMGYDVHTPNGAPGPISPMQGDMNIIGFLQNYLEEIPASKIILAVPYYGYDWPKDPSSNATPKTIPYAELAIDSKNTKISWDPVTQTPSYSYNDNGIERIVYFENVRSLGIKYDLINRKNLQGVGIWALGYDGENSDLQKLIIDKFSN